MAWVALAPAAAAHPWPTPPTWWLRQAACIERFESRDTDATSNPANRGYFQIQYATWAGAGGVGDPAGASYAEQRYRAWIIYQQARHSAEWGYDGWGPWSTRGDCGL